MAFRNPGIHFESEDHFVPDQIGAFLKLMIEEGMSLYAPALGDLFGNRNSIDLSPGGVSLFEQSAFVGIPQFGAKDGMDIASQHNDVVLRSGINAGADNVAKVRIESERPVLMTTRQGFGQPGSPGVEFVSRNNGTDPTPTPAVTGATIYAVQSAGGKTQLAVRFATGAPQIIKTEV